MRTPVDETVHYARVCGELMREVDKLNTEIKRLRQGYVDLTNGSELSCHECRLLAHKVLRGIETKSDPTQQIVLTDGS